MKKIIPVVLALCFVLLVPLATAAPLQTISYQGYLTNASSVPVTNPALSMTFSLFDASGGGSALWSESQSVTVTNGQFNVALGAGALQAGVPLGSLAFDAPYYLEVTAGVETLSPRMALSVSPYAFRAMSLEPSAAVAGSQITGAITSATISGSLVTGAIPGTVPPGYMILGATTTAPPGFDYMGPLSGGYYVFVRQGVVSQSIFPSTPSLSVNEGSTATFSVTLKTAPAANVTVTVTSSNPVAATVLPATLTFTPANFATPQTVTVTGVQDQNMLNEAATISLALPGSPGATVAVTVIDDDIQSIMTNVAVLNVFEGATATFFTYLAYLPTESVHVAISSTNTGSVTVSPTSMTFSPDNYDTPQTVTVTGVQDANVTSETVTVFVATSGIPAKTVTVTAIDNDIPSIVVSTTNLSVNEGSTGTLGVSLPYQPASNVTVTVSSNNTAVASVSPATLTFTPANYATPQTVTVTGVVDANLIPNSATISLAAAGVATVSVNVAVPDTGP
jgi:hypothetical protein